MRKWMERIAVFATAVIVLSGCGKAQYEYIVTDQESTEAPVIVIGETSAKNDVIVLETDPAGQASRGEQDLAETDQNLGQGQSKTQDNGSVTLLFGGDVLLSDHVLNAYQKSGGIGGVLDDGYREKIAEADFFMVNQEFPFSSRGTAAEDKQFTFRLPPEKISLFQEMGIDAVTLANNHALDYGTDALLDSCDTLDNAGILHTGAGENLEEAKKPVVVELKGRRIGTLGTTRVIPESGWAAGKNHVGMLATYDATVTLEEIRRMRGECDYVVVFVHWGIERDERPQDYQRTLGQQYIDAGADLVIGSHPHVLQGVEYYKGKPIVYSLGNFVFGSSIPKTALLQVTLPKEAKEAGTEAALRLIPGTSGAGHTRMLTDEKKVQEFYRYMESISFGITLDEEGGIRWER